MKKLILLIMSLIIILSINVTLFGFSGCYDSDEKNLSFVNSPKYVEDIPDGCVEIEKYKTSNSCGFIDQNGKKKIRIFSSDIYMTRDDNFVPINFQLSNVNDKKLEKQYCYKTDNSYITTYFPYELGNEKVYVSGEYDFFIEPISDRKSTLNLTYKSTFIEDRYAIEYNDVFGENSILSFYSTPKGYQQEVILQENFSKNNYSFYANSSDLYFEQDPAGYILIYSSEDDMKNGIIQKPLIKDSNNKIYFDRCKMSLELNNREKKYKIKYSVTGKDFKYPISIVNSYSYYEDRQADTQIDSQNNTNAYLSDYAVICNNSDLGIKELCVKFSYMEKLRDFGINIDDIVSAEYVVYSIYSDNNVLSLFDIDSYWCSSVTTRNTKIVLGKNITNSKHLKSFVTQKFNILSAIRRWGGNSNNWNNGLKISTKKGDGYTIITTSDSDLFNNYIELTIN